MLSNALTADLKSDPGSVDFLLFHDRGGRCLAIHWDAAIVQGIDLFSLVGKSLHESAICPVSLPSYLQYFERVLHTGQPEQFDCAFRCGNTIEQLSLIMAPIQSPAQQIVGVNVSGQPITGTNLPASPLLPLDSRHVNQLAWKIRQTLDLDTIWQQAAKGLGEAIQVCRCSIYAIDNDGSHATVKAEHCQPGIPSTLGDTVEITQDQPLYQALQRFRTTDLEAPNAFITADNPCVVDQSIDIVTQKPSTRLIIATGYQSQPNGLIVLEQCDRQRSWQATEVAFLRELSDQVGTAIAHATLFNELQKANIKAVRKQAALEEARQQAEEASRLKSEFLANTSHELRTPLNGIMGFLKLVIDGMADSQAEQDEFLREAFELSEHLLEVLNDVLNLAKIEAGKMQIECSGVNLNDLLQDIARQQGQSAYQKNLTCEVPMPATLDPVIVYGNFKCLKQVLINLAGNAIKFTHEGGITITTEIIRKKVMLHDREFPGVAMVKVADTGIGVSLEKQDRLFQSFSQIDGSLTRRYGGTGLGLAISQRLVQEMGGEINFYSLGEGLGSTVTFTVPLFQEPVINSG